jgi:hypothetical protein
LSAVVGAAMPVFPELVLVDCSASEGNRTPCAIAPVALLCFGAASVATSVAQVLVLLLFRVSGCIGEVVAGRCRPLMHCTLQGNHDILNDFDFALW